MSFLSKLKFWDKKEEKVVLKPSLKEEELVKEEPKITTFKEVESEISRQVYEKVVSKLDKLDKIDLLDTINLKLDSLSQIDDINDKLSLLGVLDKKITELGELGKNSPNLPNIEKKIREIRLTIGLQKVLDMVKERKIITTSELAQLRGVSTATASEQLGKLAELGLLAKLGKGEYKLGEKLPN